MATSTLTTKVLTGEELLRMPENGLRYELVRGELVELSPPSGGHGKRQVRIAQLLANYVDEYNLGTVATESGFYIQRDPDTVRGPDVLFFSKDRLDPDVDVEGYYELPPDLAVEIVSPGDTYTEVAERVDEYKRAGVKQIWVVDNRRRTVTIHPEGRTLGEADTLSGADVLPGFSIPVSRIFRRKTR